MNKMIFLIGLAAILVGGYALMIAAEGTATTADEVFTKLISNNADLTTAEAIFELHNPESSSLNGDSLDLIFVKALGKNDFDYEMYINYTRVINSTTYALKTIPSNYTEVDNKTSEKKIIFYNNTWEVENGSSLSYVEDWKKIDKIPMGNSKIKLMGHKKAELGAVSVDWKPRISVNATVSKDAKNYTLIQDKWAWWNTTWGYKMPLYISNNTNVSLLNYTYTWSVNLTTLMNTGKLMLNCSDLRFTNSTEDISLNYWIRSCNNGTLSSIDVMLDNINSTGGATIYAYYGNPAAVAISNYNTAYLFADNFDYTSMTTLWSRWSNATKNAGDGNFTLSARTGSLRMDAAMSAAVSSIILYPTQNFTYPYNKKLSMNFSINNPANYNCCYIFGTAMYGQNFTTVPFISRFAAWHLNETHIAFYDFYSGLYQENRTGFNVNTADMTESYTTWNTQGGTNGAYGNSSVVEYYMWTNKSVGVYNTNKVGTRSQILVSRTYSKKNENPGRWMLFSEAGNYASLDVYADIDWIKFEVDPGTAPTITAGTEEAPAAGNPLGVGSHLDFPANASINVTSSVRFNCTAIVSNGTVSNITIYIWNSTLDIINQTTNMTAIGTNNASTWVIDNLPNGNHTWNCQACAVNSSGTSACAFNATNYTLEIAVPPASSCIYSGSGDFDIDCSENCSVDSNADVGGNNVTIIGDGKIILNANVTNFDNILLSGDAGRCEVYCLGGNCFHG